MNGFKWRALYLAAFLLLPSVPGRAALPATPAVCDELTNAVFKVNGHAGTLRYFSDRFQQTPERLTDGQWQEATGLLRGCADLYARRGLALEGEQLEARGREVLEDFRESRRAEAAEASAVRQAALNRVEREKQEVRAQQEKREKTQKDKTDRETRMETLRKTMLPSRILPTLPSVTVNPDLCKALLNTVLTPGQIMSFFEPRFQTPSDRWTGAQWLEARATLEGCYDFNQIMYANAFAVRGRNDLIERQLSLQGYAESEINQILREIETDVNNIFQQRQNRVQKIHDAEYQKFQREFQQNWLTLCYEAIKIIIADPSSFSAHPSYELYPPNGYLDVALQSGPKEWIPPNNRPLVVVANYRSKNKFGAFQVFPATCIYYMQDEKFYFHRVLIKG